MWRLTLNENPPASPSDLPGVSVTNLLKLFITTLGSTGNMRTTPVLGSDLHAKNLSSRSPRMLLVTNKVT